MIAFERVTFARNGRPVLRELDFTVPKGETVALVGRSGTGKSTTLKLIIRLLEPTTGRVLVDGRDTASWDPFLLRRRTGYVLQEVGLFPHMTVAENVAVVPMLEGWSGERRHARVRELLALVGLGADDFADRRPDELSGGQRQRVGVARALAAEPNVLLMDEPFGALDPITRAELQREFQALQMRLQKTVVFVTHDMREALLLGTRIALIEAGRLVALNTPQAFLHSKDPLVASYVDAFRTDLTTPRN